MKMVGAEVNVGGEFREARLLGIGGFDEAADLGDFIGMLFGEWRLIGFAAFTGAKSGGFGGLSGEVELDIFGKGEAGGAGRAAIDAGGFDGVKEGAVCVGVAVD